MAAESDTNGGVGRGQRADRAVAEIAARQFGVVSRSQLEAAGLGRAAIQARVRDRHLQRIHRGVYSLGHSVLVPNGRLLAAVLTCGDRAVLSHRSAAAHIGLLRPKGQVHVTVPTVAGRLHRPGLRIHRTHWLPEDEVTEVDRIPVTALGRTFLDLAATEPRDAVLRALEESERLRAFDLFALIAAIERHPRRPGTARLRAILARREEPALTRSELERLFLGLCAGADLRRPEVNAWLDPYEVDFLWRRERVIAEVDGRATHATATAFERDRARDAALTARGYRVVRFTYRQVKDDPATVAGVLRTLLAT